MKFLLEILSEEIPARMQAAAAAQLREKFYWSCAGAGLDPKLEKVNADATPRRLWLIADDLPASSAEVTVELKGPRVDAPDTAIEGFLKKNGLKREQLTERDTGKGIFLFAVSKQGGRPTSDILAELIPQIIRDFAWPKSMRWGDASQSTASPRWVRPLVGFVALLDGDVVPFTVHGLASGRDTQGHRIHAPGALAITRAETYHDQLRAAHVIASSAERRQIIAARAAELAAEAGLALIPDDGLVAENAGLTEWPVPLLGRFDPDFLTVPAEVIVLTMRTNQKYFALSGADGALAPAFVCVANLDATDGGAAIVGGNQRVLSARLADARFFWEQDLATVRAGGLEAFLPKLQTIVFHEKLGTVADKVERVAALAGWLVESGAIGAAPAPATTLAALAPSPDPSLSGRGELAVRAARLAKADLVSATVGEFPELQGQIGRYLALAIGEDPAVSDAVRDHYKPAGQGDDVPTAPVSVAVALADKLDTLFGFFSAQMPPTGSKDPFALRRQALGVIAIVQAAGVCLSLRSAMRQYIGLQKLSGFEAGWISELMDFFADRLKVQQREAGVRHDLIDAVFALGGEDDLVRLLARVKALQAFVETDEGTNLLAGYKRAANILKAAVKDIGGGAVQQGPDPTFPTPDPSPEGEGSEAAMAAALDAALPQAQAAVAEERFTDAMAALASLRAPVDAFFTDVMVNDPDPAIRARRLALLARFRDAVHGVADFSKIEG